MSQPLPPPPNQIDSFIFPQWIFRLWRHVTEALTVKALTVTGQIQAADGSASAPSYSFTKYPTTGFYVDATQDNIKASSGGIYVGRLGGTGLRLLSDATHSLALEGVEGTPDVFLWRDAANILMLRNGTNAQTLRLYETFTDAANFSRINFVTTAGNYSIRTEAAGTGTERGLILGPTSGNTVGLGVAAGSTTWSLTGGHLITGTDNARDIGSAGANRPRDLYLAGDIVVGGGQIAFPATQNPSADANTLDDYEEGSWTPEITFATPGDVDVTYTTQLGRYTKVGNLVTLICSVTASSITHTTAAGDLRVEGFGSIFTPENVAGLFPMGAFGGGAGLSVTADQIAAYATAAAGYIQFIASVWDGTTPDFDLGTANLPTGNGLNIYFTIQFRT